jgi:hypothetical protein
MKTAVENPNIRITPRSQAVLRVLANWPRLTPERQAFDRWINSSGGAAALQAKINVCLISWLRW